MHFSVSKQLLFAEAISFEDVRLIDLIWLNFFSGTNIGKFKSNGFRLVCSKLHGKKREGEFATLILSDLIDSKVI